VSGICGGQGERTVAKEMSIAHHVFNTLNNLSICSHDNIDWLNEVYSVPSVEVALQVMR
jgi:hypothetical protein